MVVDLVRASNDAAELGFVKDSRLLNVLITRQTKGFFIVADERCVLTLAQQSERDNPVPTNESEPALEEEISPVARAENAEKKSSEDRKNATVIAIFDWMRKIGRVVNIAKESLTEDYVDFPKPYVEPKEVGWGDDAAVSDEAKDTATDKNVSDNAPALDNETSANATTPTDAIEDKGEFVPEERYEHGPLHDKGGEDVILGSGDEDATAGAHEDGSDSGNGYVADDEMPSADGLGESD